MRKPQRTCADLVQLWLNTFKVSLLCDFSALEMLRVRLLLVGEFMVMILLNHLFTVGPLVLLTCGNMSVLRAEYGAQMIPQRGATALRP